MEVPSSMKDENISKKEKLAHAENPEIKI